MVLLLVFDFIRLFGSGDPHFPYFMPFALISINSIRGTFFFHRLKNGGENALPQGYGKRIGFLVAAIWLICFGSFMFLDAPSSPKITDRRIHEGYRK
jgi:hypothetical protein